MQKPECFPCRLGNNQTVFGQRLDITGETPFSITNQVLKLGLGTKKVKNTFLTIQTILQARVTLGRFVETFLPWKVIIVYVTIIVKIITIFVVLVLISGSCYANFSLLFTRPGNACSLSSRGQPLSKMDKLIEIQQVNITDTMAWALFKSGDDQSLNVLLSRYFRPLLHYGSKFSKDRSLIEDVIQDLFLDFLERRTHLGNPVSVKNYLFKCLRNNLIRAMNENMVNIEMPEKEDLFADFENIEKFLVSLDESTELTSKITRFFSFLTKRQKEVLFLRYYENLDNDEIAEMMGISKQSVSNLLLKSINVLRENWIFVPIFFTSCC